MPRQLVLALLFTVLLAPAAARASSTQVMTFEAPRELLDDSKRDATLDEIRTLGVDRVRALVYWRDFTARKTSTTAPSFDTANPDAYPAGTWDRLDRLVAATQARGMTLQLTLSGPVPKWATKRKRDYLTDPSAKWFGRWVRAVARRYGDRVNLWSVWNEPNHPAFLLPQYRNHKPASPKLYRALYQVAEQALHGVPGGANDKVLFGETAPIGNIHVVSPLGFMRGAMCLSKSYKKAPGCSKLRIDGYAHHAYTRRNGPSFVSTDTDEVSIGSLGRLVHALDRAAKAHAIDADRGIYLTEFGIQSKPDPIAGVSLSKQAEYIAISERIAYANPRVKAFSQYLMADDKPVKGAPASKRYPGFETGLRTSSGKKKPAYNGFMLPLAVKRYGVRDVLWGRVRPAGGVAAEITIERSRGSGWKRLTALTTSPRGVFGLSTAHRSNERYRVKWVRPGGTTVTGPPIHPY